MPYFRIARILALIFGLVFLVPLRAPTRAASKEPEEARAQPSVALRVDPLLIAEAAEVWGLIASPNNPVWPGWDASSTPLLFYLPGEQDVLINHPRPPQGFVPYDGPVQFPHSRIFVKDGPTLVDLDGQNTSKDVEGIQTLVVADTLSNLRAQVSGRLEDTRPTAEKIQELSFSSLATDPYEQLGFVVHEAFHVFQDRQPAHKSADEWLLLSYPVLSVQNNVGFALEGSALSEALHAKDDEGLRRAAVRWLAVRKDRRASLPQKAIEYEDGTEYEEGLATYTEYRLFQVLERRQAAPAMTWAQGFAGYANLQPQRENLISQMVQNMSGTVRVNNDPYGTAPLRRRLYFSGMAAAVMLDRLSPDWKNRIFSPDASLTSLVEEALKPSRAELDGALKEARNGADYARLIESKTELADEGKAHTKAMVKEIEDGPGIGLVVDYSDLGSPKLGMTVTPFGMTVVDEQRTIFTQVPIRVGFGQEGELAQKVPAPLLRDNGGHVVRFRLPASASRADVERALATTPTNGEAVAGLKLDLPGATFSAAKAQVRWNSENLIVILLKTSEPR